MREDIQLVGINGRNAKYPVIKDEGALFLEEFIKDKQPNKVLEIGTAIGYSGSLMLNAGAKELITIEINEDSAKKAEENFRNLDLWDRVEILLGDAKDILPKLNQKFDVIFLDGPKGQYVKYLPSLLSLLQVGGYLIADNVLFRGMVKSEEIIPHRYRTLVNNLRKFLKEIENDKRRETCVHDIGDGLSVSCKIKE